MRNRFITSGGILLFTIIMLLMSGCKEDMPDFEGDNRILSFALTLGGEEYPAYTEGESKLVITIPVGVDLTDAKPRYLLSENATIFPAPERVRDWREDQVFRVTSASGKGRSYILRVITDHPTSQYDVRLTTDAEVRAFGATHTGVVRGNLIIGAATGRDSISDITPLTALTKVEQGIVINPTFKGTDLTGLRNVSEVGSLVIRSAKELKKAELRSLRVVHRDISLESDVLEEVHFPLLQQVEGTLKLQSKSMRSLLLPGLSTSGSLIVMNCPILSFVNLPVLKSVSKDLTISTAPMLSDLKVRRLGRVSGTLSIKASESLQNVSFPSLEEVGSVSISSPKMTDLSLPLLVTAENVELSNVPQLVRLSLPKLSEVTGDFLISQAGLKSLSDIPLTKVGGKLSVMKVSNLFNLGLTLEALTAVKSIVIDTYQGHEGIDLSHTGITELVITDAPHLTSLALPESMDVVRLKGFSYVSSVEDAGTDAFTAVTGLKHVGEFSYNNYWTKKSTKELSFPDIETISRKLEVSVAMVEKVSFPALTTVHALEGDKTRKRANIYLSYITQFYQQEDLHPVTDVHTLSCPLLTEADGVGANSVTLKTLDMPKLRRVDELKLDCIYYTVHNDAMEDLSSLSSLKEVQRVHISKYRAFRDYSFLKRAVESGSLASLSISKCGYNPSLDDLKAGRFTNR